MRDDGRCLCAIRRSPSFHVRFTLLRIFSCDARHPWRRFRDSNPDPISASDMCSPYTKRHSRRGRDLICQSISYHVCISERSPDNERPPALLPQYLCLAFEALAALIAFSRAFSLLLCLNASDAFMTSASNLSCDLFLACSLRCSGVM